MAWGLTTARATRVPGPLPEHQEQRQCGDSPWPGPHRCHFPSLNTENSGSVGAHHGKGHECHVPSLSIENSSSVGTQHSEGHTSATFPP